MKGIFPQMQENFQNWIQKMLAATPCLPVIAIPEVADAVPLARALQAGGIHNIEVTLRTPAALESIAAIAQLKGMTVGAGTVFTPEQVRQAKAAGAAYIVSPGFSPAVFHECTTQDLPYLPGAVTPTEIMLLQEQGFRTLKFYPAAAGGGPAMLKTLAQVFQQIQFCATGGINLENMRDYLALPNVCAIGMSPLVLGEIFETKDWALVAELISQIG